MYFELMCFDSVADPINFDKNHGILFIPINTYQIYFINLFVTTVTKNEGFR